MAEEAPRTFDAPSPRRILSSPYLNYNFFPGIFRVMMISPQQGDFP